MLKNGDAETVFAQALGSGIGVASTQSLSESIEAAQLRKTAAQNSLLGNGDDYQQYLYGPKTKSDHQALQDPYSLYAAANDPEGSKLNAFAHNPGKYDHYDQLHATQAGTTAASRSKGQTAVLGHATSAPKATESLSDKTRDLFHEAVAFEHEIKGEISHAANEAFAAAQTMTNDVKMLAHHLIASAGKGFGEAETWVASVGVRAVQSSPMLRGAVDQLGIDAIDVLDNLQHQGFYNAPASIKRAMGLTEPLINPETLQKARASLVSDQQAALQGSHSTAFKVGKFFSEAAEYAVGFEKEIAGLAVLGVKALATGAAKAAVLKGGVSGLFGAGVKGAIKKTGWQTPEEVLPQLSKAQTQNLNRFLDKIPSNSVNVRVKDFLNGGKVFQADSPASNISRSYARYEKQIDKLGNTVFYTKTTIGSDGEIIHMASKFPSGGKLYPEFDANSQSKLTLGDW